VTQEAIKIPEKALFLKNISLLFEKLWYTITADVFSAIHSAFSVSGEGSATEHSAIPKLSRRRNI